MSSHFVEGYILGFSVATTIGVSGVLCIQNMLSGVWLLALGSSLAAALADMSCGILVVFGMQAIEDLLLAYKFGMTIVAGSFLCFLGLKKLFGLVKLRIEHGTSKAILPAMAAVYFLAIMDPVSIIDFMALCVGLTVNFEVFHDSLRFIIGLFLGSATWWFSLAIATVAFRHALSENALTRIQQLVGAGLLGFGLWIITSAWK